VNKCIHCGQENDDASVLCACGQELPRAAAPEPATTGTDVLAPAVSPEKEPRLILRKLLFVVGTLALVAVYGLFRHKVKTDPLYSCLVATGVWAAAAVAGLWFLGRERRPMLLAWRIAFLVLATLAFPVILNIIDGLVEFGWPSGRFNRPIGRILSMHIPLMALAFLPGLITHLRTYRVAGLFSILAGIATIVLGAYFLPATQGIRKLTIVLGDVLNNVMFGAKLESYAAIPMGVAFIVGGILVFRAARARG
jgi:hypothetical protein